MSAGASPSAPRRGEAATHRRGGAWARLLAPLVLALLTTAAYGTLSTLQWRTLQTPSWDMGIFSQLAKDYASLRAPIVPIKGDGVNLLGDHFHPILVLLAPIWWVWPSGLALLWTQAVLFGVSAIPLTRLAMDRLGAVLGTLAGLGYALSFGLQSAQDVQFHEIAFAVPILALALTLLLRGRVGAACLWAGALVLVKEDLGLTVMVLGGIIALREQRLRWREGTALALWGLGWFILSTFVILPLLNPAGRYDYTDNVGSLFGVLVPADKWATVMMLILVAGVIGLRSPLILLMLPTLAWRFTGTVEFYWTWYWHYNAVLMPIALAALLDASAHVRRTWPRVVAVAASLAVSAVLGSSMPLAALTRPNSWTPSWREPYAQRAMAALPPDGVVAADIPLLAPLVPGHDVQWVHGPNTRVPRCVVVDAFAFSWSPGPPRDAALWADDAYHVTAGTFRPVYQGGGYQVACR